MDLREAKLLVKQGESQRIEFKKRVNHPDKVMREVVAFANSDGGVILVGVDDSGEISGLKHAEEDDYVMQKALGELCRPKINFESGLIKIDEKRNLLYYKILQSERKPHYALETATQRWGKAYIRKEDKSIQASREVLEIIRNQRDQKPNFFAYGDEERSLLRLLESQESITLRDFVKHTGIKPAKASKVLVTLTLTNVLKIIPAEPEDKYIFNTQSSN
jgi:hypothetical protein